MKPLIFSEKSLDDLAPLNHAFAFGLPPSTESRSEVIIR